MAIASELSNSNSTFLNPFSIGSFVIPKGWQVMWAAPTTHMDENVFKDPQKFDPSRFEKSSGIPPYTYVAFGAGPRVCPGSEFARIQVLLILHYMITNYQWAEKCPDGPIDRARMPYPIMGLCVQLLPRKLGRNHASIAIAHQL